MRGTDSPADEYYLTARQAVIEAIGALAPGRSYTTADGIRFRVNRKPPLRLYKLMVDRRLPGEDQPTSFMFQRNGRVNLGGARKIPLREALAKGHEPWASRAELEELAAQIRTASPTERMRG
jgi:hypothetical protein